MTAEGPGASAAVKMTPEEVRRVLADQISRGQLRPGQRLGAERALAAELGVSRATLRQALAVLEDGGVVRRVPGRGGGTFVAKGKIERGEPIEFSRDLFRADRTRIVVHTEGGRARSSGRPRVIELRAQAAV
jgi:DNA-binding GntR family transcriptional regulator